MITRRQALSSGFVLISPVFLSGGFADAAPLEEMLAVVVAKDGGVEEFSLHQLKRIYLGDDVQGPRGKIIALNREPKGPERVGFDRSVLDMSPEAAAATGSIARSADSRRLPKPSNPRRSSRR